MSGTVNQPRHIEVENGSGKVSDPKGHPWIFAPRPDREIGRQEQRKDRVEEFVVTEERNLC